MQVSTRGLALTVSLLVIELFAVGSQAAEKTAAQTFSSRDLQAKLEYCKTCHGLSGQGYRGSLPMPRLAGQQTEYFENQLHAFIEHRRENRFMFQVAHVLTPEMLAALAAHFRDLNPKPIGGASKELVTTGQTGSTDDLRQADLEEPRVGILGLSFAPPHDMLEDTLRGNPAY